MSDRRTEKDRRRNQRLNDDRRLRMDRRQARRYRVKDGIFAVFMANKDKLGQIKDISMKGLSFRYANDNGDSREAGELKIIIAGYGLYLDKIPIETVSDFEVQGGFAISPLKMRQTGLRFVDLTPEQKYQIGRFIRQHTVKEDDSGSDSR